MLRTTRTSYLVGRRSAANVWLARHDRLLSHTAVRCDQSKPIARSPPRCCGVQSVHSAIKRDQTPSKRANQLVDIKFRDEIEAVARQRVHLSPVESVAVECDVVQRTIQSLHKQTRSTHESAPGRTWTVNCEADFNSGDTAKVNASWPSTNTLALRSAALPSTVTATECLLVRSLSTG